MKKRIAGYDIIFLSRKIEQNNSFKFSFTNLSSVSMTKHSLIEPIMNYFLVLKVTHTK